MPNLLTFFLGDANKKVVEALKKDAEKISALEPALQGLSDDQLKAKTAEFKERIAKGETVDDLAYEAFAVVREASKRTLGQRHYDVQLMGGLVLHRRGIAEMRTGEGKTLTATAPLYLNALAGKGCHLVTVNDYLARRDAVWMGQVFGFLGISVGVIQHQQSFRYDPDYKHKTLEKDLAHDATVDAKGGFHVDEDYLKPCSRTEAYAADVTYGTNNEFGFDYLRDNMAPTVEQCVMRGMHYAIVDEIDSILIDEARTPLIISAPAEESNDLYTRFATIIATLTENEDYNVDEKLRAATFTEAGITKVERALGVENLYAGTNVNFSYHAENALRARTLYKRDVQYVVKDGEVVIVDEFTGRLMPGRRYSEGQHQAIEAKEGVKIQRESQTLATITFQNLFRMYGKLAGMTGTAATEAEEFSKIYNLDVVSIPSNKVPSRIDLVDRLFTTEKGKYQAAINDIRERHAKGQPILIGTVSIEKNELLSRMLTMAGVPHQMLNAKNHASEAEIIAQAGREGAVTLATNMAGRGVDIMLGGNPPDAKVSDKVKELGGLHVVGTERHESRRIDNQLRGRSGRQGDPGSTQFYLSMEDDLMRIFMSDRARGMLKSLNLPEDTPIEHGLLTKQIEGAQKRVEGHHFDTRKHLLEYDDVLNKHREVIYARRREILEAFAKGDDALLKSRILELVEDEIEQVVLFHTGEVVTDVKAKTEKVGDWNTKEILETVLTIVPLSDAQKAKLSALTVEASKDKLRATQERTKLIEAVMQTVHETYAEYEAKFEKRRELANIERAVILRAIDTLWIDHLAAMTSLRQGIGLQGYGQRDPLVEYKKESYRMFQTLLSSVNGEIVYSVFKTMHHAITMRDQANQIVSHSLLARAMNLQGAQKEMGTPAVLRPPSQGGQQGVAAAEKVGRNDLCPCGSGKKYKKCHGA